MKDFNFFYDEDNSFDDEIDFDDEIKLEKQCEAYFSIKIKKPQKYALSKSGPLRKDLENKKQRLEQEPLVRQWCSYLLREARAEAKNGYAFKTKKEKEKIINNKIKEISDFFGVDDIYLSKRNKIEYNTNSKKIKEKLPLRKDITEHIYRAYFRVSKLI